jgi:ABC-type multidrug transport system ATPase subunit
LSSGQQQRINLARSLTIDPVMLVADEPTGNLDSQSGEELMGLLQDLHNEGRTVVMVTHDLEYLKFATRAIHMTDGLIVEEFSDKDKKSLKKHMVSKRKMSEVGASEKDSKKESKTVKEKTEDKGKVGEESKKKEVVGNKDSVGKEKKAVSKTETKTKTKVIKSSKTTKKGDEGLVLKKLRIGGSK